MRFRKTINICKGVKLNLSKSGVSATVGMKGLSLNLGKTGAYLNTGIPGTGLYNRRKLFGTNDLKRGKEPKLDPRDYELVLEENGDIEIVAVDGRAVTEEEERIIRRADWYKEQAEALMKQFREQVEAESNAFVGIHRYAKRVPSAGAVEDAQTVEEAMDAWLADLELPVDFDVQYEYDEGTGTMMLDLDLPEIEDMPEEKVVELACGTLRAKPKSQKEIREEYQTCVFGLAVFFASHAFLASEGITDILVSGYTQRRDQKTGELEDHYVYSIAFKRRSFETSTIGKKDPFEFCSGCKGRLNALSTGVLKEIVPYTREEFLALCEK